MTKTEAMAAMMKGKKVRLARWKPEWYFHLDDDGVITDHWGGNRSVDFLEQDEMWEDGWELYRERSTPRIEPTAYGYRVILEDIKTEKAVITDRRTGLQWAREYRENVTWDQAHEYATELNAQKYGGHSDWRVPTIDELETLLNRERYNPASDFQGMPSAWFWSSSSYVNDADSAWYVDFGYGYVDSHYKTDDHYVRCVRSGPC